MRILTVLILFFGLAFGRNAYTAVNVKPFLWKAVKNKSTIYLFGTMHLPHPVANAEFQRVKKIIDSVDEVYTEIPLNMFATMAIMQASLRDDNKTLQEILPKDVYDKLQMQLKKEAPYLNLRAFDKFKIWAVALNVGLLKYQLKYRYIKPLDKQIYEYAKARGKKVGGVEKVEEQIAIFDSFSRKESIEILRDGLIQYEKNPKMMEKFLNCYAKGDGKCVIERFVNSMQNSTVSQDLKKRYLDTILYKRNIRMAKRIAEIVSKNPNKKYLFAFGAMHFLSKRNVLDYLKKEGFKVKKLLF